MKKLSFFIVFITIISQLCFGQSYQDYLWLTDCERIRQEFTPPDSTTLISEPCGNSQKFLTLNGPDSLNGDFHTNDFIFKGASSNSVKMTGCVSASGSYSTPPTIPQGSLEFPPNSVQMLELLNQCNIGDTVIYKPPFDFNTGLDFYGLDSIFITNAQNGGLYIPKDSLFVKRVVFDTLGIEIQQATKQLLTQLGPQGAWNTVNTFPYPPNGAFYVDDEVYVGGVINGDLTLGASGNIFIDNDLKYVCTDSTGLFLPQNCDDKLGLVSEKNIFLDTRHIATNKGFSWTNTDSNYAHNNHQEGVIVNAGIVTYGESFAVFSADFPNFERFPNDPYGGTSNPNYPLLGNHGTLNFLGTLAQKRRGILNQGTRGGYGGTLLPNGQIGPQRVLVYDSRFATLPPQNFPIKVTSIEDKFQLPENFKLEQNFPNPFNPSTTINYKVPVNTKSKLTIFNILGEKVKEFNLQNSNGSVVWNGTNNLGKEVSSGVYFYRLETNTGFSKVKKMVFLK